MGFGLVTQVKPAQAAIDFVVFCFLLDDLLCVIGRWDGVRAGTLVLFARRDAGLEPGISLQKYFANTRELRWLIRLVCVPRALLHIFHRDGPDSSHYSLRGLNSPRLGIAKSHDYP